MKLSVNWQIVPHYNTGHGSIPLHFILYRTYLSSAVLSLYLDERRGVQGNTRTLQSGGASRGRVINGATPSSSRRFWVFALWIIFSVFQKNRVLGYSWSTLLWHRCYYLHRSRDALSPVCGIFLQMFTNFFLWVAMSVRLSVLLPCNVCWALSLALRSHQQFPGGLNHNNNKKYHKIVCHTNILDAKMWSQI